MFSAFNNVAIKNTTSSANTITDNGTSFSDAHCFESADQHLGHIIKLCGILVTEAQSFSAGWTPYKNQDELSFVTNILVDLPTSKSDIPHACDTIARKVQGLVDAKALHFMTTGSPSPIAENGGNGSGIEATAVTPASSTSTPTPGSPTPVPAALTGDAEDISRIPAMPMDTVTIYGPDGVRVLPAPPTSSTSSPWSTQGQGRRTNTPTSSNSETEINEVAASIVLEQEEDIRHYAEVEQRTRERPVPRQPASPRPELLPLASTSPVITPPTLRPTRSTATLPMSSLPLPFSTQLQELYRGSWITDLADTVRLYSPRSIPTMNLPSQSSTNLPGMFSPPVFPPLPSLAAIQTTPGSPPPLQYPDEVTPSTSHSPQVILDFIAPLFASVAPAERVCSTIKQEEDSDDSEDDWLPTWGGRKGGQASNLTGKRSISRAGPRSSTTTYHKEHELRQEAPVRRRSQRAAAVASKAKTTKAIEEGKGPAKAHENAKEKAKVARGKKDVMGVKGKKEMEKSAANDKESSGVRRPIRAAKAKILNETDIASASGRTDIQPPAPTRRSKRAREVNEEHKRDEQETRPTRRARTTRK